MHNDRWRSSSVLASRLRLKCDGTRAESEEEFVYIKLQNVCYVSVMREELNLCG
jgi:hypothetical protein